MTNKEARDALIYIKASAQAVLDTYYNGKEVTDAFDVAIKALEQEPMVFKSSMLATEKLEKCRQSIKEQIEDGVVLLPYYIDLISPYESNTEQLYVDKEPPVYKEGEGDT